VTFHIKGANGSDGLPADKNPNSALLANGKGMDHFDDLCGPLIVETFGGYGIDA